MSIEQIRADVHSELITFGSHLVERMFQNGISIDQVFDVILTGSVRKKEPDERSFGKFTVFSQYPGERPDRCACGEVCQARKSLGAPVRSRVYHR